MLRSVQRQLQAFRDKLSVIETSVTKYQSTLLRRTQKNENLKMGALRFLRVAFKEREIETGKVDNNSMGKGRCGAAATRNILTERRWERSEDF